MAQGIKYLPHKHEDLICNIRTHVKAFLVCCPVFIQGNGKETGEPQEAHGPSSLAYAAEANETVSDNYKT